MAKKEPTPKLQSRLYNIVDKNISKFAKQKSERFNKQVDQGGWNKKYLLAGLTCLILIPLAIAVIAFKEGIYRDAPGYEKVNQAIMAPHAEEEIKEKYLKSLEEKNKRDSISASQKRKVQ
jgi:hypothetical protein